MSNLDLIKNRLMLRAALFTTNPLERGLAKAKFKRWANAMLAV